MSGWEVVGTIEAGFSGDSLVEGGAEADAEIGSY